MKNLINAVKKNLGIRTGKLLFGYEGMLLQNEESIVEVLNLALKIRYQHQNKLENEVVQFRIQIDFVRYFHAGNSFKELPWGALDDVVMGGVSQSTFQIDLTGGENGGPTGLFKGYLS